MGVAVDEGLELLSMCNEYASMLTLEAIPGFTEKLLGRSGFAAVAGLFRTMSRRFISRIKARCCPEAGPLDVLRRTAELNMASEGEPRFRLMPVKVTAGPGRVDTTFKPGRSCDILCAAPLLGLVAGAFEESGLHALIAPRRVSRESYAGKADILVYPIRIDCSVVMRAEELL